MRAPLAIALAGLILASCGGDGDDGVGGVTREEEAALDNAAEMLDASPDSLALPAEGANDTAENAAE